MFKLKKQSVIVKISLIIILSIIYAFGVTCFLQPSNLVSMGLTGVAQLVSYFSEISFGVIYLALNIPGIILSFCKLGKRFTFYSVLSILVVTLTSEILSNASLPASFTDERIVNCFFAAAIMGFSLGGLLKIGASSGGFDFYCLYAFKKFGIPFSYINMPINLLIVAVSGFVLGIETMLFTIIYIFIREIILNLFYTNNQKVNVWIIGEHLDSVADYIHKNIGRGTSIFKEVRGGYTNSNKEVIMVVLNVVQFAMLKEEIYRINPNVFIFANKTYDVIGNYRVNK